MSSTSPRIENVKAISSEFIVELSYRNSTMAAEREHLSAVGGHRHDSGRRVVWLLTEERESTSPSDMSYLASRIGRSVNAMMSVVPDTS